MDNIAVTWWMWVILGLVLLAGEVLTPGGFFIFFFGAGAVVVGLLKMAGLATTLPVDGLIFLTISVAGLVFFRKPLQDRFHKLTPDIPVDLLQGEIALAQESLPAGSIGKVELRGTTWNAQNMGPEPLALAQRCRVERVEGLTLFVRALDGTPEPERTH
ncbi:MAG: NfeD family protein [Bryobacteraceae bacterium]|nr:NfeD family protein [Solibacteraceae bacterium]MCL4840362.1 NfeD family protein [Bryobacteraceae bacterium]MCO5349546.1 NfeD family protein [Bryobacteraceae bacterium]